MDTVTKPLIPTAVRKYLTFRCTNPSESQARIVQVFYPGDGWVTLHFPQPVDRQTIAGLAHNRPGGATMITVGYKNPMTKQDTWADFTVRECLAD